MAGTLQTLLLTLASTGTVPLQRRNTYFPTTQFVFSGDQSVNAKRKSLFPWKLRAIPIKPIKASEQSNQANGGEESTWAKPLLSFATNNFLPLALVSGVAAGLANPTLGCLADKYSFSKFSTFGIFIISGLTLRSDEIGAATEAWPVGLFGLGSILLFTPFFSRFIVQLQLQPQEFVTGLAIFSCMPTTLSSGVALTRLAGGNSALALAMTLMSNLLGILIWLPFEVSSLFSSCFQILSSPFYLQVPFSISKFVAAGVGISVPTRQLFRSLVATLLVPVMLGKVFREAFKGLADFVDRNSKLLSLTSAILLSLVPWMQVSRSRSLLLMVKPAIFLVAVGMGIILHIVLLVFNALSIQSLSAVSGGSKSVFAKKQNATALLLVASQKTLPVMVAVVEQLGGAFGESGLLVLPCVAAHLNQIILDSFLVSFWLQKEQSPGDIKAA